MNLLSSFLMRAASAHLKQVVEAEQLYSSYLSSEYALDKAFYIHFAQGLVNLGKVSIK